MRSKSLFDSGNWSEVNGLPGQNDMLAFLRDLTGRDKNRCFTRRQLMDEVAKEFEIPTTAQEAEGPNSNTSGYYTRLTYLIADGIHGVRRSESGPFLKRLEFNVYQHVEGDGKIEVQFRNFARSKKQMSVPLIETPLEEAIYLIRHANKIGVRITELRTLVADKFDGETWNLAEARA